MMGYTRRFSSCASVSLLSILELEVSEVCKEVVVCSIMLLDLSERCLVKREEEINTA